MSVTTEFVPSIFSNRFYVTLNPTFTRITFADQRVTQDEVAHTGIVLTTTDALALANLILKMSADNRAAHPDLYKASGSE